MSRTLIRRMSIGKWDTESLHSVDYLLPVAPDLEQFCTTSIPLLQFTEENMIITWVPQLGSSQTLLAKWTWKYRIIVYNYENKNSNALSGIYPRYIVCTGQHFMGHMSLLALHWICNLFSDLTSLIVLNFSSLILSFLPCCPSFT